MRLLPPFLLLLRMYYNVLWRLAAATALPLFRNSGKHCRLRSVACKSSRQTEHHLGTCHLRLLLLICRILPMLLWLMQKCGLLLVGRSGKDLILRGRLLDKSICGLCWSALLC